MNLILAVGAGLVVCWLLAHIIVMCVAVSRANRSKVQELRHLQGSLRNIVSGRLKRHPEKYDYRVVQGVEWDGERYVPQSRLSTEAIKAAFFQR